MNGKTLTGTALAAVTLAAVLAGCGGNTSSAGSDMSPMSSSTPTAAGQRGDHNQADVTFAQHMIPHHAQAIEMSKMVPSHTDNPKILDLANRIEKAQDPEIQQMSGWLKSWGASVPSGMDSMSGMSGMSNMPGHSMSNGQSMPGMMSDGDMSKLRAAKGPQFDQMWPRMMIQHHQGAIEMAKTELAQGSNADAKNLARNIMNAQQAEITEMRGMLEQS